MLNLKKKQFTYIMLAVCMISALATGECELYKGSFPRTILGIFLLIFSFFAALMTINYFWSGTKSVRKIKMQGISIITICLAATFIVVFISDYYLKLCIGEGTVFGIITSCILSTKIG